MDYSAIQEFMKKAGGVAADQRDQIFWDVFVGANTKVVSVADWASAMRIVPDSHSGCDHEPVDVGFQFSKIVCKKCNKEMPGGIR